ncbi:MAG TPA: CaiB/BaiF CoA-transferase family protein [Candidatus Limnocylindrales bacterium]|nr:CaiB/BaiF CoA-transferase family protein [Candidatus Limnocylindrales bacterium]
MGGALAGIKIVEAASYVTGPFASQLLADLGAEVIKVEEPARGDPFRGWGERNYAATFCSLNRNKKSVTIDFRTDEGRDVMVKLLTRADVFIQNFRPGVLDRRGLGYDDIKRLNAKIVYCSISGFGPKGPYRDMPGYDTIGQARSGLLSLLTDPGKPQGMGISFSDHLTGMYACYGVLGALMNRMLTGEGQHVETSLLRASVSFIAENAARYFETGHVPRRKHRTTTAGVFAFEDQDGLAFVLHMSSPDKFWLGLFEVVGKPEWANDPRFNNRKVRVENYDALNEQLAPIFRAGKREDWLRRLIAKDVPAAPINSLDEVFADPQVKSYGFPIEVEHPQMGKMQLIGNAVDMSRTPPSIDCPPPMLGEQTEEVLSGLGLDANTIENLRAKGAI